MCPYFPGMCSVPGPVLGDRDPTPGEAGSQRSQSDCLLWSSEAFLSLLWVSVLLSDPRLDLHPMAPSLFSRAHLPSRTACSREMKVLSACLHTSVSSRITGTHLLQLLAWWGQGGGVREQSKLLWGLGPEGEWYLEAELWGLGSLGYGRQLQEVPTDDQLDPSKWLVLLPDSSEEEHGVL